ncbi:MAG: SCO family protein, partial [Gammaproteobacteria bacterium]|nr:SCO family protein [Gammaproteobacteria bacterium]
FFLYLATYGSRVEPVTATNLPMPRPLPAFSWRDQRGDPFTRESLTGGWHLVFFGFTNCPDICPATLQQLAIARNRVLEDGGDFPRIVLVSVDPERDTPAILKDYVASFGDDVIGVTGDRQELIALTKPLGIYFEKSGQSDSDYSVDHSSVVLLIDGAAEWRALFSAPHDVASFVHDVPLLTAE